MPKEGACRSSLVSNGLRISSIPFAQIPAQSSLFSQFQSDPKSLGKFYPNAVAGSDELSDFARTVLVNYKTDRPAIVEALHEINSFAAGDHPTFLNIERLRDSETVAVFTGQQAGLFSGPLYTIYKALSAIKLSDELNAMGVSAVPMFWVATEDHDFAEIAKASVIDGSGLLADVELKSNSASDDAQVGSILLEASISETIDQLFASLPATEFSGELEIQLRSSWKQGATIGEAFITQLAALLGRFGLIFVDPLNSKLKTLASPVYQDAIERSGEIVSRLRSRSVELERDGFHSQVLVEPDYFPLFLQTDDGSRSAIRRSKDHFVSKRDGRVFSSEELLEIAREAPHRFSPGVMLRPVVQDYLFPTLCYFGGAAEIAYFAQNSVVYDVLDRPATPILHRQSFTIVEPRIGRALEAFDLDFCSLFEGYESIAERLVGTHLSPETGRSFTEAEQAVMGELDRLDELLARLDVTLAANLAKRREKIGYHIRALRKKADAAVLRNDATAEQRLRRAFASLYPHEGLQERSINVSTYLNKYGDNVIDWIYSSIDLDDRGHRVMYL